MPLLPAPNRPVPLFFPGQPPMWMGGMPGPSFSPDQQLLPPQPPPPIQIAVPEPPSQKDQEAAFEFISWWGKSSYDYTKVDKERRDLLRDMFESKRALSQWNKSRDQIGNDRTAADKQEAKENRRDSDNVIPIAPIIHSTSHRALRMIFAADQPFQVKVDDPTHSVEDKTFSTSYKLQQLLNQKLYQGHFEPQTFTIWQDGTLFGTTIGKMHWFTKSVPQRFMSQVTMESATIDRKIYDCPILEPIDPDRFLPDWEAKGPYVQQWLCVGNRVDIPVFRVFERFREGTFHLNYNKVFARWGNQKTGTWNTRVEGWQESRFQSLLNARLPYVTVWEVHGLMPTASGQYVECVQSVLTDIQAESPADGIQVRLGKGTILNCGFRPYLVGHYTPMPRPYGQGAIEPNLDIIYVLSQLVNLFVDCVRYSVHPMVIMDQATYNALGKGSPGGVPDPHVFFPGKLIVTSDPAMIKAFALQFPHAAELLNLIRYYEHQLEKRTGVSDTTLGMGEREKTAFESHVLVEGFTTPLSVRLRLWTQSFLEPALNMALSMIQQYSPAGASVVIRNASGIDEQVTISEEELRTGQYRVMAVLDQQDEMDVARAQSIERILPVLEKVNQKLLNEDMEIRISNILKRYVQLNKIDDPDNVIVPLTPQRKMQLMGPPMPSGGGPGPPGGPPGGGPPGLGPGGMPLMLPPGAQFEPNGPPAPGSGPEPPRQLLARGGPMGARPTNLNALAQILQLTSAQKTGNA